MARGYLDRFSAEVPPLSLNVAVVVKKKKKKKKTMDSKIAPDAGASRRALGCWAMLRCGGEGGFLSRFRGGSFGNLFSQFPEVASETAAHADTVVNLFTLGGTLLLTCPYALMGSLQTDSWLALKGNLASCAANPWTGATPWGTAEASDFVAGEMYPSVANSLLAAIYCSLFTILASVVYFLTRPNGTLGPTSQALFRVWWARGRVLLVVICVGMVCSLVSVLVFSNTFCTNFVAPRDVFCSEYKQRWLTYIGAASSLAAATVALLYIAI